MDSDNLTGCAICGKHIPYRFSLCRPCQNRYGYYASDREPWANYLVRQKARTLRRVRRKKHGKRVREVPLEGNVDV